MEDKNNNQQGGGNSFLLGAVIGTVATLLFTTKKGREIVREITEKGLEKFTELEDALKSGEQTEIIEEGDYLEPELRQIAEPEAEKVKLAKETKKEEAPAKPHTNGSVIRTGKPSIRRFFKGSKKS